MSAPTLTERLRLHAHRVRGLSYNGIPGTVIPVGGILAEEAASLITTLERQLATAREALEKIAALPQKPEHEEAVWVAFAPNIAASTLRSLTPGVSDAE